MKTAHKSHSVVALLPMKGHSARVPGKNFRPFANKPLFRWILDTLLTINEIDLIVINTDARQILASHGLGDCDRVLIRDRKEELRGDLVSMNRVLADDVANVPSNIYLMTHTTNPLMSAATIRGALSVFRDGLDCEHGDSLFAVNKHQTRFYRADGSPINHDPARLIRTQDLEPWYEENSNLYIFTADSFAETAARIGKKPIIFETPRLESLDIDDETGWNLAEILALSRQLVEVGKRCDAARNTEWQCENHLTALTPRDVPEGLSRIKAIQDAA